MKLLHIDSSALGANSVSRELTRGITARWLTTHPGTDVDYLDLAVDTPNHLNVDSLGFRTAPGTPGLNEAQQRENAISERLVRLMGGEFEVSTALDGAYSRASV